jgi:hypothetical protein
LNKDIAIRESLESKNTPFLWFGNDWHSPILKCFGPAISINLKVTCLNLASFCRNDDPIFLHSINLAGIEPPWVGLGLAVENNPVGIFFGQQVNKKQAY